MRPSRIMLVVALLGAVVWVYGGDLDPPAGPIGPTMKTLSEVQPRTAISSVPCTISVSGSYYLTGDLQVDPNNPGNGITVEANNVTIDLMGYSLVGPGPGSGANHGIHMNGRNNIEVRNGTVQAFGSDGINEPGYNDGKAHRIVGVRVISNGNAGIYLRGHGHLVKDCTAWDNGSYGIYAGHGSTVTGNTAYNNQGTGIYAEDGSTAIGNTAYRNAAIGLALHHASTVSGNSAYYNQETGIYAGYGCTVIDNTAYLNNESDTAYRAGIYVSHDCLVKGNTVSGNWWSNICVYDSDNAIEENLVTNSTGYGIYFGSSGNFYANNRASGNPSGNYAGSVPSGSGDGGGNASF